MDRRFIPRQPVAGCVHGSRGEVCSGLIAKSRICTSSIRSEKKAWGVMSLLRSMFRPQSISSSYPLRPTRSYCGNYVFCLAAESGPVPQQAQPGTLLDQINYAVGVEFAHDVAAVHLDRPAGAVELQGHFIRRAALEHQVEHLLFHLGQRALR
jgi:hypothetical protein